MYNFNNSQTAILALLMFFISGIILIVGIIGASSKKKDLAIARIGGAGTSFALNTILLSIMDDSRIDYDDYIVLIILVLIVIPVIAGRIIYKSRENEKTESDKPKQEGTE